MLLIFSPEKIIILSFALLCLVFQILSFSFRKNNSSYFSDESNLYELIHDIKTPAAAHVNIMKLFLNGAFGEINSLQKDILNQLQASSKYMLNIINNISTLCSFEHDNIRLNFEVFDINETIKMCIDNLKYSASEKRCNILFDYSDEKIYVNASKLEITRVLYNLLTNALKYSYSDRIITATTKIKNNKCLFEVNSYGDCLNKNEIKEIFNKYKSLNKTGNGLGLYVSNLILRKHNCDMIVRSDLKRGNSFGFELNLYSGQQAKVSRV